MLTNPTYTKLQELRLHTMAHMFKEQLEYPEIAHLSFEERLSLLVDGEVTARSNRRLQTRLRSAKLQQNVCLEDIDYYATRDLNKALLATLSMCQWVDSHQNILIVGATGTGKTYLACALAHKACMFGHTVQYHRVGRLLSELQLMKGDGQYGKRLQELSKMDVLILDDFGLSPLSEAQQWDLLEILDDRHNKCSTVVTSQIPVKLWHDTLNDKTLADAILDRLIHNAHRLEMKGESMRKKQSTLATENEQTQNKK